MGKGLHLGHYHHRIILSSPSSPSVHCIRGQPNNPFNHSPVQPPINAISAPPRAHAPCTASTSAGGTNDGKVDYEVSGDYQATRARHERAVNELLKWWRAYTMVEATKGNDVRACLPLQPRLGTTGGD